MKKIILFAVIMLQFVNMQAQKNDKYTAAMKTNLAMMDSSFRNPADMLKLANNFERIAIAEKTQWLAYYYAAFCQINYAFIKNELTDAQADKSESLLNKADSLMPNNSEISCLKSMIATQRMLVNPQQRFMQYGQAIDDHLAKAREQDPTNPRPYYLKGENLKGTPAQFGGGCRAALPELEQAAAKFATFKPASEIAPDWGRERITMLINECKK